MRYKKTVVILPTYNEKENISQIIKEILGLKIRNLEILVVDDSSPDKTGEIVTKLKEDNVHLLIRKGKRGRGLAGIAGFKKALQLKADYIIEMDADFSHNPKYIPEMLKEIKRYDIVLGSRLVRGSEDNERTLIRNLITRCSNAFVRLIMGLKIKDCNSGYRCFKAEVIQSMNRELKSEGPDIVQEVLYKSYLKGYKIKEIPIKFDDRRKGSSKFGIRHIFRGFWKVIKLKFRLN